MKNKILFFFSGLMLWGSHIFAQAEITFEETSFDFGKVQEGMIATHEFTFRNTGTEPLILSGVRASCGCTTPRWTKEPVMPGKTGVITASYNSKGRPGAFNKSITINSNAASPVTVVYIKGNVVKETDPTKIYSAEELATSPRIQINEKIVKAGKVEVDQSVPLKLTVKNNGKSPLVVSQVMSNCRCVFLSPGDNVIQEGQSAVIDLVFRPRNTPGAFSEKITIMSNDLHTPEISFALEAEIVKSLTDSNMLREDKGKVKF